MMDEKNLRKLENIRRLKLIGILPGYIDGNIGDNANAKEFKSKNYDSYDDFATDLNFITELAIDGAELPIGLLNKLEDTIKEIGPLY